MSLYTIGCTVSAAATLQIPQLLKMCMEFLLAELNVQTCVYIWNIAAAYGLLPVCDAARRFVLENFVQFAETPLFTQLTLEQISAFPQDDAQMLPSEVTAFQVRGQTFKGQSFKSVTGKLGWNWIRRQCFTFLSELPLPLPAE